MLFAGRWRIALVIGLSLSVLAFFYIVRQTLAPVIAAFIIAYLLLPIITMLEKKGLQRSWAIIVLFAILFGTGGTLFYYLVPLMFKELTTFAVQIPNYISQVQNWLISFQASLDESGYPPGLSVALNNLLINLETRTIGIITALLNSFVALSGKIFDLVLIPVMTYYFLRDWDLIASHFQKLFPHSWRSDVHFLINETNKILRAVIRGHLILALMVGVMTTIGMWLIGMEYSLLIGVMAGIADIIPYFGPFIGAAPAIIFGLLISPATALWAAAVMFAVQQIESNIISPRVFSRSLGLHPLVIIIALLMAGHLYGIIGLLLAVPVVAVGRIIINYIVLKVLV